MKRAIPIVSLSIIFGVTVSFMEGVSPSFNLNTFNIINFKLLSMLLSIFIVLLLILFSKNIFTAILSFFVYAFSFMAFMLYAKIPFGHEFYVRMSIIVFIGMFSAIVLFLGRDTRLQNKTPGLKVKRDIAFPIIFFLASILISMAILLFEQKNLYNFIPTFFYSYLYFLIAISAIVSFFSFNEISGFLIGSFSVLIYFLMNRLIINSFNIYFLLNAERSFALVVLIYVVLFGICTSILAHSSALLLNGIALRRGSSFNKMSTVITSDEKPMKSTQKEIPKNNALTSKDNPKTPDGSSPKKDSQIVNENPSKDNVYNGIKNETSIYKKNKESDS